MNLNFINLKDDIRVWEQFKELYLTAFPKEELFPVKYVKRKAQTPCEDCVCIYDESEFIGILCLAHDGDLTLIFYFAIAENMRAKGYGSAALSKLKQLYPDRRLVLNIERTDKDCANLEQRLKRKAFYERNGFSDAGYLLSERGVVYNTYCYGGAVPPEDVKNLLKNYTGRVRYALYYKIPYATKG